MALDKLVDGYGLHFYPNQKTAAERLLHLKQNGLEQCRPLGSAAGKQCWVTEWGFNYAVDTCPVDAAADAARTDLVRELRGELSQLAKQNRLKGLFFYNWQGNIHARKEDRASAFRCGTLTGSGRLAIDPMERAISLDEPAAATVSKKSSSANPLSEGGTLRPGR
jgi:hypothetical protein